MPTVLQDFMILASVKYVKIASSDTGFHASSKTITEDVIVMVLSLTGKHKAADSASPSDALLLAQLPLARFPSYLHLLRISRLPSVLEPLHIKLGIAKSGMVTYGRSAIVPTIRIILNGVPTWLNHVTPTNVGSHLNLLRL